MNDDIFKGHGVKITLPTSDDFLKIKETLTRIGVSSRKENKLYQSVHILHKRGLYALMHFKQLFALDGRETDFSEEDHGRLNAVADLLAQWKLVIITDPASIKEPIVPISKIKILAFKDKADWILISKYTIGKSVK